MRKGKHQLVNEGKCCDTASDKGGVRVRHFQEKRRNFHNDKIVLQEVSQF